jgi:hypothetical protein
MPVNAISTVRGRRIFHKMNAGVSAAEPVSADHNSDGVRKTEPMARLSRTASARKSRVERRG